MGLLRGHFWFCRDMVCGVVRNYALVPAFYGFLTGAEFTCNGSDPHPIVDDDFGFSPDLRAVLRMVEHVTSAPYAGAPTNTYNEQAKTNAAV